MPGVGKHGEEEGWGGEKGQDLQSRVRVMDFILLLYGEWIIVSIEQIREQQGSQLRGYHNMQKKTSGHLEPAWWCGDRDEGGEVKDFGSFTSGVNRTCWKIEMALGRNSGREREFNSQAVEKTTGGVGLRWGESGLLSDAVLLTCLLVPKEEISVSTAGVQRSQG